MGPWRACAAIGFAVLMAVVFFPGNSLAAAPPSTGNHFSPLGELDCNGFSSVQQPLARLNCADPSGVNGGFTDNGYYIGHDEPNARFISNVPGSANDFEFRMQLPTEPTGSGVTSHPTYQNTLAFWIGFAVCDNNSYPQHTCINDSDLNTGIGVSPKDAGSAVVELQFYPPNFPPFSDVSCNNGPHSSLGTKWCAALNIDSLECTFEFGFCNSKCTEPVNFAFLTRDGIPVAPPSPQLSNAATFAGNQASIFRMNPGDQLLISVHDTAQGVFTGVQDLTTHGSGFMVASGHNGFMNTNLHTCKGTPYNFHPEYSSAGAPNIVPWAALQLGVSLDVETGHWEVTDGADSHYPGGNDNLGCTTSPIGQRICFGTDFDFDGIPYRSYGWPHTSLATFYHPSPINLQSIVSGLIGPASHTSKGWVGYSTFEFETDAPFTLNRQPTGTPTCNILVPNQCTIDRFAQVIPTYGGFYPFWSSQACTLYFGDVQGSGVDTHGGDRGYGGTVAVFSGPVAIWGDNGAFYQNSCA